jgi:periplasmic protein TonB
LRCFVSYIIAGNHDGGSGGSHDLADPIQGHPPRVDLNALAPPQVAIIARPKLEVDPAIDIRIPDSTAMPNLGVLKSGNVTIESNGPGDRAGIGLRGIGGVGPGNGPGYGPGSDAGVYIAGLGGVTVPVPIFTPEAEFSDEARRQKYQGICLVAIIVDAHGVPQNIHVVRHLGMGLDEKAMEAIRKYRFKPATKDGKPVAAAITVEVDFRLF